ncbi:c-type cytochrome [Hydrogenophaga sp. BPS33]|uniref:c-type cytochrome n=1 Tax=Hydrogenophaga sp. BPS33 TaxID=2651974 RepID=UPI001916FD0F|nr:c-type cytochrome [Hydrogenophaga sp. BPS33]
MGKRAILVLMSTLACWTGLPSAMAREGPPSWAYPMNPPGFKLTPDDGAVRHVPDSRVRHTLSEVRDRFLAPDWHPDAHPPMPAVVARGRPQNVSACGYCHRAEGTGGPENSSLAGLSAPYILQQLADYKSGARSTAVPYRKPQTLMIATAKALSEEEAKAVAAYFSALKPRQNIQVVESKTVPKTYVYNWFLAPVKPPAREPIGQRIIELNNDLERFENRDPRVTFTAYVPPGSIRRGQALVDLHFSTVV